MLFGHLATTVQKVMRQLLQIYATLSIWNLYMWTIRDFAETIVFHFVNKNMKN